MGRNIGDCPSLAIPHYAPSCSVVFHLSNREQQHPHAKLSISLFARGSASSLEMLISVCQWKMSMSFYPSYVVSQITDCWSHLWLAAAWYFACQHTQVNERVAAAYNNHIAVKRVYGIYALTPMLMSFSIMKVVDKLLQSDLLKENITVEVDECLNLVYRLNTDQIQDFTSKMFGVENSSTVPINIRVVIFYDYYWLSNYISLTSEAYRLAE